MSSEKQPGAPVRLETRVCSRCALAVRVLPMIAAARRQAFGGAFVCTDCLDAAGETRPEQRLQEMAEEQAGGGVVVPLPPDLEQRFMQLPEQAKVECANAIYKAVADYVYGAQRRNGHGRTNKKKRKHTHRHKRLADG